MSTVADDRFALVTVIHNSAPELARLLDSIDRHLHPRPRVIVVDDGSSDDGAELAATRGCEVLRQERARGFGAACNVGVAAVSEPVTVLINPDCELRDDGLRRLAHAAIERHALVAPRLLHQDGHIQDSAHPLPGGAAVLTGAFLPHRVLPARVRSWIEPYRTTRERRVGWAIAACIAAPTELLHALGPFDPQGFLFYEDLELCLRAAARGYPTWLLSQIEVVHTGGTSVERALGAEVPLLKALRRREVVRRNLGRRRLVIDDLSELATYGLRLAARTLLRRDATRDRRHLHAHLAAIRAARGRGAGATTSRAAAGDAAGS